VTAGVIGVTCDKRRCLNGVRLLRHRRLFIDVALSSDIVIHCG